VECPSTSKLQNPRVPISAAHSIRSRPSIAARQGFALAGWLSHRAVRLQVSSLWWRQRVCATLASYPGHLHGSGGPSRNVFMPARQPPAAAGRYVPQRDGSSTMSQSTISTPAGFFHGE
jgi:hypothetical protein